MKNMVQVRGSSSSAYQAPDVKIGRSQFNLSRRHKTTFDAGYLIPYFLQEVLPGDTITCKLNAFVRIFSPLSAPVMDDISVEIDYFFVPNRLVWDNWKYFMGEHDAAGAQDTTYTIPILTSGLTLTAGSSATLGSYFGIPLGAATASTEISCLPFRGFRLIYNEWYRDQNLIDELTLVTDNGPDNNSETGFTSVPPKSAKRHDYFTSALPYLQKGTAQTVVLSGVSALDVLTGAATSDNISVYSNPQSAYRLLDADLSTVDISPSADADGSEKLYVDASAGYIDINDFRESLAIQRLLEKDARGGTRYNELIYSHFGVTVPDYRVQRPEYLGGGKGYINISPVANTSPVDSTASPDATDWDAGRLAGQGAGSLSGGFAKSFTEHGYVFGILRARGEITYQQGLDRHWSRSARTDFYFPDLAHLGEQPIYNRELWLEGDTTDDNVFGYQERFAEYRFAKSLATGKFSSDATGSLDYWHLAEDLSAQPTLAQAFIEDATPMSRVTTVANEPDFIVDGYFDVRAARPMPIRAVPSVLGFGRL